MPDNKQLLESAQKAQSEGNLNLALQHYQQALIQQPDALDLHAACGNLCVHLQRFEEAAGYFRRILLVNKNPDVRNALCFALQRLGNNAANQGQYALAEACFAEALEHQPNNAAYWYNLGNAQRELANPKAALTSFQKALHIDPNDADTYNNLGNVQRELGQLDLAIENYEKALEINPQLYHALAHLVHQKQHICDWRGEGKQPLDAQISTIRHWVRSIPEAKISPFAFLAMPSTTALEQKTCASQYLQQNYVHLFTLKDKLKFTYNKKNKTKIKVAYLSADFRLHPLAFLITELIEKQDKNQFETFAYSYGVNDKTPARKRLENAFDHFVDIQHLSEIDGAKKINGDHIDILVDLTGFTQSSRTGIVALKPTPISISWLGYPGTMGNVNDTPLFDYLLADNIIAPNANNFSEKLLSLPCYQPNSFREIGKTTPRNKHGLPDDGFVFCSFNQTFKITADIFSIWMRLLKQVPNSVLWLLECNQWAKANLLNEAESVGINPARLIFAPRTTSASHLERQQHADLFLDTLPYNAHTTTSDALWMGLPVLTCKSETFSSRVAASLLETVHLPELVCTSLQAYEAKALHLATHPTALAEIKETLKNQIRHSDLFNSEKFARTLEKQYKQVWHAYLTGADTSS